MDEPNAYVADGAIYCAGCGRDWDACERSGECAAHRMLSAANEDLASALFQARYSADYGLGATVQGAIVYTAARSAARAAFAIIGRS
jgi:hypothetical protein